MVRIIRQPFKPGGKFLASKDFKFHGKKYKRGKEFPWRTISCSVRKLRTLYEGRFIDNDYLDPEDELIKEVTTPEGEIKKEVDDLDEDTGDNDSDLDNSSDGDDDPYESKVTIYDPDLHEIVNPERGEWYMDLAGVHQVRLEAKEAKRLRKKLVSETINPEMVIEE